MKSICAQYGYHIRDRTKKWHRRVTHCGRNCVRSWVKCCLIVQVGPTHLWLAVGVADPLVDVGLYYNLKHFSGFNEPECHICRGLGFTVKDKNMVTTLLTRTMEKHHNTTESQFIKSRVARLLETLE